MSRVVWHVLLGLGLLGLVWFLGERLPPGGTVPALARSHPTPTPIPRPTGRPPAYPPPWGPGPAEHFLLDRPYGTDQADIPLPDSRFGTQLRPQLAHLGIDLPALTGTPIRAVADGLVVWAGQGFLFQRPHLEDPYGVAVFVRHDVGWGMYRFFTLYAHMKKALVQQGQRVRRGQVIGLVGATGMTTGPHLHLELRFTNPENPQPDRALNPELWMAPYLGWGVLVGQVRSTYGWYLSDYPVIVYPEIWSEEAQALWYGYRTLRLRTYELTPTVEQDPVYGENFAAQLPAGRYRVLIRWYGLPYEQEVTIAPGRVTFFRFLGSRGFVVVTQPGQWPPRYLEASDDEP